MDASQVGSGVSREEFRELGEVVCELQRRVAALEQRAPVPGVPAPPPPLPDLHVSSDMVPTVGRALLAVAGAYLLRALTEWKILPVQAGVILGILYAGFWLWHATRAAGKLAAMVNAITAAFIFGPLTWEATMNLRALPTLAAAGVIGIFSIAAIRRREVAAIASSAGAAIALTLLIGTHDLVPFTLALVAIAAAGDWAALPARWFSAVCADAAIAIMIVIVAGTLPEGYAAISKPEAIAAQAAFFLVFAGAAVMRTVVRGRIFMIYEIGQTAVAFLLAIGGALYLTRANTVVGTVALLFGTICYAVSFGLDRGVQLSSEERDPGIARGPGGPPPTRNIQTYATFGALLVMAGLSLLLSGMPLILAFLALAAAIAWTSIGRVQAPAFLWAAMLISGVATACALELFGTAAAFPRIPAALVVAAGAIAYLGIGHPTARALIAAAALWSAAGLGASFGAGPVILTLFAIGLAWGAARWKRPELTWLMYGLMIASGSKILFHDFSRESTATLVASLLVYGAALIALPKLQKR